MKITDGMIERGAGASRFPGEELRVLAERRRLAEGVLHAALDYVREPKAPEAPASGKLPRYRDVQDRGITKDEWISFGVWGFGVTLLFVSIGFNSIPMALFGLAAVASAEYGRREIRGTVGPLYRYELDE